jgi:hypothetical protein
MSKRDSLRRRLPTRTPYPRILIVSEGRVTEPGYFNEMQRVDRRQVALTFESGMTPKTAVETAARMKHEYDQVWCVFDIDSHPLVPDARQQARDNNIDLAISNPCFELWAVLHFQDQRAHIDPPGLRELCRRHMPGYVKQLPFDELFPHVDEAMRRAEELEQMHERNDSAGENPSTGAHQLVRFIRSHPPALER